MSTELSIRPLLDLSQEFDHAGELGIQPRFVQFELTQILTELLLVLLHKPIAVSLFFALLTVAMLVLNSTNRVKATRTKLDRSVV